MANHVFLSLIKTKLDTFTKSERKIAEYILKIIMIYWMQQLLNLQKN